MNADTRLHEALLGLGLEDLIPLPEILGDGDEDVRAAFDKVPSPDDVAAVLVDLLRLGEISVLAGRWDGEPRRLGRRLAENAVNDLRRYDFKNEASGLERIYYANVTNLR